MLLDADITIRTKSLACSALDTFCDETHSDIVNETIFEKILEGTVQFMTKSGQFWSFCDFFFIVSFYDWKTAVGPQALQFSSFVC